MYLFHPTSNTIRARGGPHLRQICSPFLQSVSKHMCCVRGLGAFYWLTHSPSYEIFQPAPKHGLAHEIAWPSIKACPSHKYSSDLGWQPCMLASFPSFESRTCIGNHWNKFSNLVSWFSCTHCWPG